MKNAALLLCGGSGTRMRGHVVDKVLTPLVGKPAFIHVFEAFYTSGIVQHIVFAYRDEAQRNSIQQALDKTQTQGISFSWARGGKARQDSVLNALLALPQLIDYVFIHDCARPVLQPETLQKVHQAVLKDKAAVLAHRVVDTIKRVDGSQANQRNRILEDVLRDNLWAMETPQAFERELITQAYQHVRLEGISVTDDAAALSLQNHPVTLVENPHPNPKLTVPADFPYLELLLAQKQTAP